MKKIKDIGKINGRIATKNICLSPDERLKEPIIECFGRDKMAIYFVFCKLLNLKDDWELENFMTEKLMEATKLGKRDNLTKIAEKILAEHFIKFYEEKLKGNNILENQRESYKEYINDSKKILERVGDIKIGEDLK